MHLVTGLGPRDLGEEAEMGQVVPPGVHGMDLVGDGFAGRDADAAMGMGLDGAGDGREGG